VPSQPGFPALRPEAPIRRSLEPASARRSGGQGSGRGSITARAVSRKQLPVVVGVAPGGNGAGGASLFFCGGARWRSLRGIIAPAVCGARRGKTPGVERSTILGSQLRNGSRPPAWRGCQATACGTAPDPHWRWGQAPGAGDLALYRASQGYTRYWGKARAGRVVESTRPIGDPQGPASDRFRGPAVTISDFVLGGGEAADYGEKRRAGRFVDATTGAVLGRTHGSPKEVEALCGRVLR